MTLGIVATAHHGPQPRNTSLAAKFGSAAWKNQLTRLETLNLPLLANGGGTLGKAPVNTETGICLSSWQTKQHTIEEIRNAHKGCIAAGTKTGNGSVLCFDLDGRTAIDWCIENGCDPLNTKTWQIHRNTDESRIKVLFKLTEDQEKQIGTIQISHKTREKIENESGEIIEKGEAAELFNTPLRQILILGEHKTSKGFYFWPENNGPEDLKEPDKKWLELAIKMAQKKETIKKETKPKQHSGGVWKGSYPCPICSRPTGWCAIHEDGKTIRCFNGSTHTPPLHLKAGEKIIDNNGTLWAFSRIQQQADGHEFSNFTLIEPKNKKVVRLIPKEGKVKLEILTNKTKPKTIEIHEITPLFLERHSKPLLNIRNNKITIDGKIYNTDQLSRMYIDLCNDKEKWPKENTLDCIIKMAEENSYDPVLQYLDKVKNTVPLPMDQWENIGEHLLGVNDETTVEFLKKYLISAVARVYKPGCEARIVIVLVGPQHRGKSSLGRILFGRDYWVEGLADFSKDSRMRCQTAWGVELSELDGITRRSDIEALKTFLTEQKDLFRPPYGKSQIDTERKFVFFGTSNKAPLRDQTGNTRFLCIPIPDKWLPLEWLKENRDSIWSRAVQQFETGIKWYELSEDLREQQRARNEDYQQLDPWAEILYIYLNALAKTGDGYCTIDTLFEKLEIPIERRNNTNTARIKDIVESFGWEFKRTRVNGTQIRGVWKKKPREMTEKELNEIF